MFVKRIGKREGEPGAREQRHLRREIVEGLRFVLGQPLPRPIVVTDGLFSLFLIMYQAMLLVYLVRDLQLGSAGMGLVLSTMGCGGMPLGGLLGGATGTWFGAATTLWIGAIGMTLTFLPAFLSPLRK